MSTGTAPYFSKMTRILLTGGAGYIGSVLAPELLTAGYAVTVVDNLMHRQFSLAPCFANEAFAFVRGDVRDERVMAPLLAQADAIIPLAALVGAPLCDRDPIAATGINREAVRWLCEKASPQQRIILPVTNSGYGIGEKDAFCTEDSPLRPVSLYGRTKVEAEASVLERPNSLSFRFATIFGLSPRMRLDLLVNDFAYRAYRDRALVIFEGHFRRNFLHIRDASRVFLHALTNFDAMAGRAYNVGLEEANLTKLELCARIKNHFPDFTYMEAAIGKDPDQRDYLVSNQRILSTGFQTEWDLDRGLAELKRAFPHFPIQGFANV